MDALRDAPLALAAPPDTPSDLPAQIRGHAADAEVVLSRSQRTVLARARAYLGSASAVDPERLADELAAVLARPQPAPLCRAVTLALRRIALDGGAANRALQSRIFSEAAARALASGRRAAVGAESKNGPHGSGPPIDALVAALLRGQTAAEVTRANEAPARVVAHAQAYLCGALLRCEESWLEPLWRDGILPAGGLAWDPLPALLRGAASPSHGASPAPGAALLALAAEAFTSGPAPLQQAALAVLAADSGPGSDAILRGATREPDPALRTAVALSVGAAAQAMPDGRSAARADLLERLCEDPFPAPRAAAALALRQHGAGPRIAAALTADLRHAGPEGRLTTALAAACAGAASPEVGELLVSASEQLGAFATGDPAGWAGLERFTSAAWPLRLWLVHPESAALAVTHALEEDRWLLALGGALASAPMLRFPVPDGQRASLRMRALRALPQREAAFVLRACLADDPVQAARIADLLTPPGDATALDLPTLGVVAVLAPVLGAAGGGFAPGLLSWLSLAEDDAGLLDGAADLTSARAEAAAALGVALPHLPVPQAAAVRAALGLAATPASPIAAAAFLALEGVAPEVSLS